jgi:hypothetical protein
MSMADELKKLEELRWNGTLTDAEFAKAKAALLAASSPAIASAPADGPVAGNLAGQLSEVRYQNELARIDREWETEKEQFTVPDRFGQRQLPTTGMGRGMAVIGGVFGILWTVIAFAITSGAPDEGPFAVVKVVFPLFGIAFTVGMIWFGIRISRKAEEYMQAHAAYQARRAAVKPENFH